MGLVEERKWLTPPSAEEPPTALSVFGVLRRLLAVFGVLRKVFCEEVVSAWLMWVNDELLRGSGSREALAEMEDIAGGAREERVL
jgi:hypothetical protein